MVGLKNRPANAIRVAVVPDNRQATLQAFVRAHLTPGAQLYTDEAAAYRLATATAGRVPMTRKEPQLHTTPEALAQAVVRTRPHRGPERVKVFAREAAARHKARDLARTFPQVEVVPCSTGYAVLADGCPYLTNGRISLRPMPAG